MRKNVMENHEDHLSCDEPSILSLEAGQQANTMPDDHPPEPPGDDHPTVDEAYWAGRNFAMRRSARWAA